MRAAIGPGITAVQGGEDVKPVRGHLDVRALGHNRVRPQPFDNHRARWLLRQQSGALDPKAERGQR